LASLEIKRGESPHFSNQLVDYKQTRGLVSKETVVLRRWGRETQNFGFMN